MTCCRVLLSLRRPCSLPGPSARSRASRSCLTWFRWDDFCCPLIVDWICASISCVQSFLPCFSTASKAKQAFYLEIPSNFLEKLQYKHLTLPFLTTTQSNILAKVKVHPNSTPWYPPHHQVLKLTITHWSTPPEKKDSTKFHGLAVFNIYRIYQSEFWCLFWGNKPLLYFSAKRNKKHPYHPCLAVEDLLFERLLRELLCKRIHQFHLHLYAKLEPHRILTRGSTPFQPETMWRNHSELESCTVFFARIFLYLLCVNFFGFVLQKSVSQKSEQTAHAEGLKTMVNRSRHEPYCLAHRRRRC